MKKRLFHFFFNKILVLIKLLKNYRIELVFVDDGSSDNTLNILKKYKKSIKIQNTKIRIIKLSRNFGHQKAVLAGIHSSSDPDALVIIDADLQDPPILIKEFIAKWEKGFDVVYGIRKRRKGESLFKIITARFFYRTLNYLMDYKFPLDTGDFRLIDKKIVKNFKFFDEDGIYIRGLISWMGFKQIGIEYNRDIRYAGVTKYPLKKMFTFALDAITSFSSYPLKIIKNIGFLVMLISLMISIYAILMRVFTDSWVSGWTFIIVLISLFGGLNFVFLGIIAEYILRLNNQTKKRPRYIIECEF